MKIEPGTDIAEAVRAELSTLAGDMPGREYLPSAAKIVRRWIEFLDSIPAQRMALASLLGSLEHARKFIESEQTSAAVATIQATAKVQATATVERRVIPAGTPEGKALRVRRAATDALTKAGKWRTTGDLVRSITEIDPSLAALDSSTVSAAMDYGWRKMRAFSAAELHGTKMWGLLEWSAPEGGKLLERG